MKEGVDRIGAAEVKAMAARAHQDMDLREELFDNMLHREGREARNAAWVLTHLPVADNQHISLHRDALVQMALTTADTSQRRLTLALLERLTWDIGDVRTDLLDFCLEHMMLPDEPYGVKSLCIKLSYQQCRHYPELQEELRQALLLLEPSELGAGVRHTRKKILDQIKNTTKRH